MNNEEVLGLWEIKKIKWNNGNGKDLMDYVVAPKIDHVLEHLNPDFADPTIEITAITKIVYVNKIL